MPSPYSLTATLGSLIFLMRHAPQAADDLRMLSGLAKTALDDEDLELESEPDRLRVQRALIPLDAPGATLLNEQMLLHGLGAITARPDVAPPHYVRLAGVLAAFAGTYGSFEDVIGALGPSAEFFTLRPGRNEFEVFRTLPFRPRTIIEPDDASAYPVAGNRRGDIGEIEQQESVLVNPEDAAREDSDAPLRGQSPTQPRPALHVLLRQGHAAIAREDWSGLLETALQIIEAESEAPTDLAGSTYRIELKRLLTRRHLAAIARLAPGEHRQETVALLRRFGADSTEILMALLVEAMSMGERRGYYNALIQMSEGTETIVAHLNHSQWYVIRNAADLCGEMRIAEAVPDLARQVQHPDERVRKSVAEALAKIGTAAAIEPLRQIFSDPSPVVRLQAVTHLGGRGARGMSPAIGEMLRTEQNTEVQQEALKALGRIGTPDAVLLLREAASPGGKEVRRKPLPFRLGAVRALAVVGPPAQDALLALSKDEAPEVRAAASEILAGFRP